MATFVSPEEDGSPDLYDPITPIPYNILLSPAESSGGVGLGTQLYLLDGRLVASTTPVIGARIVAMEQD